MVESGKYCLRANPNGVDINRNWDDNFGTNGVNTNPDTNPGSNAFSEPETRILKKLMEDFQPHTFLDIHSGNLGLYLPNKLSSQAGYAKKIESFLSEVNDHNCKCPLGIADEEVGYKTSGSSLDYCYDKAGARFSIAMEIYVEEDRMAALRQHWEDQKVKLAKYDKPAFLQIGKDGMKYPVFQLSIAHSDSMDLE